jgi:hypothetical protein
MTPNRNTPNIQRNNELRRRQTYLLGANPVVESRFLIKRVSKRLMHPIVNAHFQIKKENVSGFEFSGETNKQSDGM